jgi:hypothetical protein
MQASQKNLPAVIASPANDDTTGDWGSSTQKESHFFQALKTRSLDSGGMQELPGVWMPPGFRD